MGIRLLVNDTGYCKKTALTGSFLRQKMQEYEGLKAEIESLKFEVKK